MKNVSYIINGILAVAIIILFILFFSSNKKGSTEETTSLKFAGSDSTGLLPIAYINVDSIYLDYNFAKDANDALMKRYNSSSATLNSKQKQLEAAYAEYQRKAQNNVFLSQERAQQEAMAIQKMETDLQALAQRHQEDYMREQQKMNGQIADSIRSILGEFNKTANYQVIFTNNGLDNIVIAKSGYDITAKIVTLLNNRYRPEASK